MKDNQYIPIKGYEGLYEINRNGDVMSLPRKGTQGRMLKRFLGEYFFYILCKDGKCKKKRIHRLLAINFLDNNDEKPLVNHLDGDKFNNSLSNLEWCTHSENIQHAYDNGLITPKKGELNGNRKLSADQVRQIRQIAASRGKHYKRKELSLLYGVSECTIKEVVNRRRNRWQGI